MNIEFHYYITYLIAAKAGYSPDEAYRLAYSSQHTNDNITIYEISKGKPEEYRNFISQTADTLKPDPDLIYIYLLFHYIPGDPLAGAAVRKDGRRHWLITTPDSENANKIFLSALESESLYNVGIACHAYADTFAHQNFVGLKDEINCMYKGSDKSMPVTCHASARQAPDWPALTWIDPRLSDPASIISNKERVKAAAGKIFKMLRKHKNPGIGQMQLLIEAEALMHDLEWAIGDYDDDNSRAHVRLEHYRILSREADYGGVLIKDYNKAGWLSAAALKEDIRPAAEDNSVLKNFNVPKERYTWRDASGYRYSDWYRFQEAVKSYQKGAWEILFKNTFSRIELDAPVQEQGRWKVISIQDSSE